jgi:hypothetical protein
LTKNLELANKELALAGSVDKELADHLIGDALENVVSAFDGFGREICLQKDADIRFQNLSGAAAVPHCPGKFALAPSFREPTLAFLGDRSDESSRDHASSAHQRVALYPLLE